MLKMQILVGLPGSGKSTYANEMVKMGSWFRVNYDQLRWFDDEGLPRDYKFSRVSEETIKAKAVTRVMTNAKLGYDIIVDNTNLSESSCRFWMSLANNLGMRVEVVEFNTHLDECLRRNASRTGWQRVPRAVIERMALFNNRVPWPSDQKTVIVDVDGTLADGGHRDHHVTNVPKKDWKTYHSLAHLDKPIKAVIEWTRSLYDQYYYVCVVSGRGLESADLTVNWLDANDVKYHRIFMRNAGDHREDSIIKKEILDKITPNINVSFAIDDRPRVIRMWRENGIRCYDVGKGVEF